MSATEGPNIIADSSLVLSLDCANRQSYPGSGITWYDLAGTNHFTLVNSPTFDNANRGSMIFNGNNNFGRRDFGVSVYSPKTTGSVSLEIWGYFTGPFSSYTGEPPITNLAGIFGHGYFGGYIGYGLGLSVESNAIYRIEFQPRNGGTIAQVRGIINLNQWYHITGVLDRTITNLTCLYFNGTLIGSISCNNLLGLDLTPNAPHFQIGANTFPFYCGCKIASAKLYSRALTSAEVLQNYNATKSRFLL